MDFIVQSETIILCIHMLTLVSTPILKEILLDFLWISHFLGDRSHRLEHPSTHRRIILRGGSVLASLFLLYPIEVSVKRWKPTTYKVYGHVADCRTHISHWKSYHVLILPEDQALFQSTNNRHISLRLAASPTPISSPSPSTRNPPLVEIQWV